MVVVSTTSRRRRVSHHIQRKPASNLYHAMRIATVVGLPLNQFVTVTFGAAVMEEDTASQLFEAMRHASFDPWIRRPSRLLKSLSCPPTHAWVIEAAGGVVAAHWAVHIPPARLSEFKHLLPRWLEKATGIAPDEGAIDVRPIENLAGVSLYMRKGMDPVFAPSYGVNHVPQGKVSGKRSGYTRNIGPTAKRDLKEKGLYQVRPASKNASRAACGRSEPAMPIQG